jgi:hypothetical protein
MRAVWDNAVVLVAATSVHEWLTTGAQVSAALAAAGMLALSMWDQRAKKKNA